MEQNLKKIMADILDIGTDKITDDLSIDNTESWDSLKHMELVAAIEEEFNLSLTSDEIVTMRSFGDIRHILQEQGV